MIRNLTQNIWVQLDHRKRYNILKKAELSRDIRSGRKFLGAEADPKRKRKAP